MKKKEIEICETEMHLEKFFCFRSNLSNYDIISTQRLGLKTGMDFRGHGWVTKKNVKIK